MEIKRFNTLTRAELYKLAENPKTVNCWNYKTPSMIKKDRKVKKYKEIFLSILVYTIKILLILWTLLMFIWLIV